MDTKSVELQIRTLLQAQIVQALNSAPEAIEKMVDAAISGHVDSVTGEAADSRGWTRNEKIPYIDYLVRCEIRQAARRATVKVVAEKLPEMEEVVRQALGAEPLVKAVTHAIVNAASHEWKIDVTFSKEGK